MAPATSLPVHVEQRLLSLLQVMTGLAMVGLTCRQMTENNLHWIFGCLPTALCLLPLILAVSDFLNDPVTRPAVIGVLTGVNAGFLTSVTDLFRTHLTSHYDDKEDASSSPSHSHILQYLELLFIPALILTLLDSFQRAFWHFPSARGIKLALVTAFIIDCTALVSLHVFLEEETVDSIDRTRLFLELFPHLFMLTILPLLMDTPRAWVLCLIATSASLHWQVSYLGAATWNLEHRSFPVPGCFIALVYVFHCRELEQPRNKDLLPTEYKDKPQDVASYVPDECGPSVMWHVIAYMIERMSLLSISHQSTAERDAISSCVISMLALVAISSYWRLNKSTRVTVMLILLFCYWSYAIVNRLLNNGLLLDSLMGLTLVIVQSGRNINTRGSLRKITGQNVI